jgi:O-antigen/teichoic acid export membrane protein
LLGYGGWMFATNVIYPALASADQFIIGSVMGVASVAHYAVPMGLVVRSAAVPIAFGRTLFPRISSLSGDEAHTLGARALSSLGYGFATICAPAIILSPTFLRYWIGADFANISAPVAQVLFPGVWMSSVSMVAFILLQSQGRADLTGKLSIIEFLPFVAILWVLTTAFGIVGAAAAWTLRNTVDALVTFWLSGMRRKELLPLAPPAALLAASLVVSRFLGSNIIENFLVASFAGAASIALGCLFSEDWRALILGQMNRTRVFLSSLTGRAKPAPPVSTNPQK